jgi:hypothetical protein
MIIKSQSVLPASIEYSLKLSLFFPFFIVTSSSFAPSDSSNNSTDHTMKNMSQSANQTVNNHLRQAANQNVGNANDGDDSNITEKAKNIGKNVMEGAKNS